MLKHVDDLSETLYFLLSFLSHMCTLTTPDNHSRRREEKHRSGQEQHIDSETGATIRFQLAVGVLTHAVTKDSAAAHRPFRTILILEMLSFYPAVY